MGPAQTLEIKVGEATLTIVPAVHFHVAFAEEVNAICCNPMTRPDAIVVELGPSTAIAVMDWLKELGIGPQQRQKVPCMLGYVKQNRYLRPSFRGRAMRLQIESGRELAELSDETLELELGFRAASLVPLSPTDSIIEALRCACELDVPAYGVDLEDSASLKRTVSLFPDPIRALGRVAAYAKDNQILASRDTDPEVNGRREYAMAARLKALLKVHHRVLFTCGLAHWRRVINLMEDSGIRPAEIDGNCEKNSLPTEGRRVVVHPAIAVQFMDRFPAVARFSERWRRHPLLAGPDEPRRDVPVERLYGTKLRQATQRFARIHALSQWHDGVESVDAEALDDFPRVVRDYCMLMLRDAADISATHICGRAFLGERFAQTVLDRFMDFPWVSEGDVPGCVTLSPAPGGKSNRVCLGGPSGDGKTISIRALPGGPEEVGGFPYQWIWNGTRENEWEEREGSGHTWEAWDDLVTALSDSAICRSTYDEINVATPFEGTMQNGLATKATIRAFARGEDTLYVFGKQRQRGGESSDFAEGWPVVWLFDREHANDDNWHPYLLHMRWLERYAKHPAQFMQRYGKKHTNLLAVMGFGGREDHGGERLQNSGVSLFLLRGLIAFSPVFPTTRQYTRWVEHTNCAHNPLFTRSDFAGMPDTLAENNKRMFGHFNGKLRWQDEMVGMALPFAGAQLTVVAPRGFALSNAVHSAASKLGKQIATVHLDKFGKDDIDQIKRIHSVMGTLGQEDGRAEYVASAEILMGESRDRYQDRVPARWRAFGFDR